MHFTILDFPTCSVVDPSSQHEISKKYFSTPLPSHLSKKEYGMAAIFKYGKLTNYRGAKRRCRRSLQLKVTNQFLAHFTG